MRLLIALAMIPVIVMDSFQDKGFGPNENAGQIQNPLFSFGIIADVQYADAEPAGTRFYRSSLNKLHEALDEFKKDSVDFVVALGDMIDRDYKSYKPVADIIDSSGLKFYHVTGNHDFSVDRKYKKRLPFNNFSKNGYYSITHKSFRFIFLNGNEISTYSSNNKSRIKEANELLSSMKEKGEVNAVDWNGGISKKQLEWLNNQMNDASNKNENVFLICHFPVFPENIHNILNYKDVLAILGKYHNAVAWFNGHNHSGNYGNFNKTHFVTMKGMVETENLNSFARVDVYSNKIRIAGSGREKSQILAY